MPDSQAIIDIGSNSVRLVVYGGTGRVPPPIFNEKVMAGLGAGLRDTGALADDAKAVALAALARFRLLLDHMGVKQRRVVATAAVRDARNGPDLVREIKRLGLPCEVISAGDEARLAGEGVLSAFPDARGLVGDLGGGSLELTPLLGDHVGAGISLPLGVLRLKKSEGGEARAKEVLKAALQDSGLRAEARGRPFFMVGGSWRALARIDMIACNYPLPATHGYTMAPDRLQELRRLLASPEPRWAQAIAPARLASSPVAAMLLDLLVRELQPSGLVVSSFGIREGLLFSGLNSSQRALDPLLEAARDAGGAERRFGIHGDALDAWLAPVFDDPPELARLRRAACLLADVAWSASPDFRAERGVEMALHGNWVGIDAAGRVILAQALAASFGGDRFASGEVAKLAPAELLGRARQWGLGIRLGQRLCGGAERALEPTRLRRSGTTLTLQVERAQAALAGEAVRRRLDRLAAALGCTAAVALA